jgi:hypothetical protein
MRRWDPSTHEVAMLKAFKGVSEFYGNATVYITDGNRVQKFEKHNYLVQNVKNDGDDIWVSTGVIVALGACCPMQHAIEQLKKVIRQMEGEPEELCQSCHKPFRKRD